MRHRRRKGQKRNRLWKSGSGFEMENYNLLGGFDEDDENCMQMTLKWREKLLKTKNGERNRGVITLPAELKRPLTVINLDSSLWIP